MRQEAVSALAAVLVTAMCVIVTTNIPLETGERSLDALAWGCIIVAGMSLVMLARAPQVALIVAVVCALIYAGRGYPSGPIYVAQMIALVGYTLATDRRRGIIAAVAIVLAVMTVRLVFFDGRDLVNLPLLGGGAIAVLTADAIRARAERRRHALEAAQRQRAEERLALARDLHDSVAHAMAAINVQAGVAAHVIERSPAQAAEALEAIRVSSRDVLSELTALLDVLRDGNAPRAPVPDLCEVDTLVKGSELAGVVVQLSRSGAVESISPAVSIAAYRVVQEALTNVARHSGSDRAEVTIDASTARVVVEVTDRGEGAVSPRQGTISAVVHAGREPTHGGAAGSGRGLEGIRERVAGSGGQVRIGPRPGGGFAVRAEWLT